MSERLVRPAVLASPRAAQGSGADARDLERLRWKCRRGMLELDLLLGRFLETRYAQLDVPGRLGFAKLLAAPDVELAAWIAGTADPPEDEVKNILKLI